jgi:hypothetical protein
MAATELMERLLIHPLRNKIDGGQSSDRLLIVIDALDEAEIELVSHIQLCRCLAKLVRLRYYQQTKRTNAVIKKQGFELRSEDPRNAKDLLEYS